MSDITCPSCKGTGTKRVNPGGLLGFNPGNRMVDVACYKCNGTGKVKDTTIKKDKS